MFCQKCGKEIGNENICCPYCGASVGYYQPNGAGMYPPNQNQQNGDGNGYQQPPYDGYYQPYVQPNQKDIPNTGCNVLAFFFPIIGLILYLVWKDETPLKAKAVGKAALIGFIVGIVLSVLGYVLSLIGMMAFI